MPGAAPEIALFLWWLLVFYDERGLLLGALRSPPVAGTVAGWLAGMPGLGFWIGMVFLLGRPMPVRSGGKRSLSRGVAAAFGAGIAANVHAAAHRAQALHDDWLRVDAGTLFLGLVVGWIVAFGHQALERRHRVRLDLRELELFRAGRRTTLGDVRKAWRVAQRETIVLALGIAGAGLLLRSLMGQLPSHLVVGEDRLVDFGADGGTPAFFLAAAALVAVIGLAPRVPRRTWVFVTIGLFFGILLK